MRIFLKNIKIKISSFLKENGDVILPSFAFISAFSIIYMLGYGIGYGISCGLSKLSETYSEILYIGDPSILASKISTIFLGIAVFVFIAFFSGGPITLVCCGMLDDEQDTDESFDCSKCTYASCEECLNDYWDELEEEKLQEQKLQEQELSQK